MGYLFSFYFGKLNSELTDPSVCPNLNANVTCTKSQGHWIISNVWPDQCIFKGLFKKPDTQIAHFDAAVCGLIGYISQTNVIRWEFCFYSPSSFFLSAISDVGHTVSSFLFLKKIQQCIRIFHLPSYCRHISSIILLSFGCSLIFPVVTSKQTTQ